MSSRDAVKTCESLIRYSGYSDSNSAVYIFGYLGWYLNLLLRSKCTYAVCTMCRVFFTFFFDFVRLFFFC